MKIKNNVLPVETTLASGGRILDLGKPLVMGILNATPDSFYTQGRENSLMELLEKATEMLRLGAKILDVGGASSRPGSGLIDPKTEQDRVLPVIEAIHQRFPDVWISIDTYHASTAQAAVQRGASMINDISGGEIDPEMIPLAGRLKTPLVITHMQGRPEVMQNNPRYEDLIGEIMDYFVRKMDVCRQSGVEDLLIDPGFGFGKSLEHNYQLLASLDQFNLLGKPILVGLSRKSMIYKALDIGVDDSLNGTTALHMVALMHGARILRAHDVREAIETVELYQRIKGIPK